MRKITQFLRGIFVDNSSISEIWAHIRSSGTYNYIYSTSFDGEKNLGEIGPIKDYRPDYDALRLRSWQSYLESDITQTIFNKFVKWVVGSGLRLEAEPAINILNQNGIELDVVKFSKDVESLFALYSNSKDPDYAGMVSLNKIQKTAWLNTNLGGDVLVILRLIKGVVKIELIDGEHIQSPLGSSTFFPETNKKGNIIKNGVEINKRGEHVAYHILKKDLSHKRVKAKTSGGILQAYLVYGLRYRLDEERGIPRISVNLETLKKMERYKEATVGAAEERQKIPYFIKHGINSTGENPLNKNMAKAFDTNAHSDKIPTDINGKALADTIAASTNKQVFNMPQDSSLESLDSKNELYFKDFYMTNVNIVSASLTIPPEVAMSKYDSNFSSSRAALKDWEHTLMVERSDFKEQLLEGVYNYWLHVNILQGNIKAPGYLEDVQGGNIQKAYQKCRFIGIGVPHIDPLKEVLAERAKLGDTGKSIPLTTVAKSTETLNAGDSDQNMTTYADELNTSKSLKIEPKEPNSPLPGVD